MSENNQLLKEILKEVREIKAHIIPASSAGNGNLTYIPELNKYVTPDYKIYASKENYKGESRRHKRKNRSTRKN